MEKYRARCKEWKERNRAYVIQWQRDYRVRNREAVNASQRDYYRRNKFALKLRKYQKQQEGA